MIVRRGAASLFLSAGFFQAQSFRRFRAAALAAMVIFASSAVANAVIIRGIVTDPLGAVVVGARVQLIQGKNSAAVAVTGDDGTFEIRSTSEGRFVLLTSAATFTPGVSDDFFGGRTEVVTRNIVLSLATVKTDVSVTASGIPTPLQQVSSAVMLIPAQNLLTQVGIVNELRQSPGVDVVQTGQAGGVTSLFVRGGNSTANQVTLDGITMNDVGGVFDFGTVSTTGIGGIELYRGSNSALYGTDAGASVVNLETPRGTTLKPVLNYSGDAGNFHEYRNEGVLSGTLNRLDYLGGFSRFDMSNALARDRYHSATSVANVGMSLIANTQMRFTIRNAVSATGLPGAHDFYGISADAKQGDQDIYSGLTLENSTRANWHNLVRYDITRKREQQQQFTNVGTPISYDFNGGPCTPQSQGCFTEYFGNVVTIHGANGYTATGRASFFVPNEKSVSNRDELYYQSDYTFFHNLTALFGFRYENERGSFVTDYSHEKIQRTNYQYTLQFQGDFKNRFFYSLGGGVEKNHLYGITGTPRIGFAFIPVRTGNRLFQGTKIRANVATGVQEPSLALEFASFYNQLLAAGDTAAIAKYNITPPGPQRSRTYDVGVDQNILGEKLIVRLGYFHNTFDHQMEGVSNTALEQIFGYPPNVALQVFTPYLNSLAFRAQGIETEAEYQLNHHIFMRGGYTYLDSVVLHSFTNDAYSSGLYNGNPNLPGIPIGAEAPLVGQRTFRRPPHTGFFAVQYESKKFTAALKGALASRSDDSTFLDGFDVNFGNTLVLPNRNLAYGYAKLDLGGTYAPKPRLAIFTQLENLLSQQHIGPIGYPSLPFTFRAGLKFRLGGD
jgi:iron complex outermembrane receptor protein/vitamin B12 transporter